MGYCLGRILLHLLVRIPVDAQHKTEAEAYINFMCRTEVAKANAEYIGYSTPHTEARKLLDPAIGENPN